eukprot:Gregarina_sp_Pseudo_9__1712@NODE_2160_length_1121_cov_32_416821_g1989_i0_p4_GENE_NODE_2160_length_1121_cov_32_416821_g1989_i0NODE_2160_length_1121_cov_32_416821_g1989_i0_p4_ORF_typecomplete_len145_score41_26HIT/PF01230_23/8e25HIT/PF01230_23/1_1e04DcpS_C/PF11969_8/4_6e12GalP_UDP_tr_C/PF02744_17/0_0021CwfJ_C_1/PF04677_15/0_22_NODE_2160_length_1121_cov_32_416821_g1989_i049483
MGSAYEDSNIFAKILRKEIPAAVIFETEHSIAILDAFPATTLHSLLIPKCKVRNLEELGDSPVDVLGHVMRDLARLDKMVREAAGADATNVITNGGRAAGQIVPHLHFHVLPRKANDGLLKHPKSRQTMLSDEENAELLAKFTK